MISTKRDKTSERLDFYAREPMRGCLLALEQLDDRKDAVLLELAMILRQIDSRTRQRDHILAEFEASLL